MYWLVFLIILLLTILEVKTNKINSNRFYFIYLLLTFMIILRCGQGSDYYNYQEIYKEVAYYSDISLYSVLLRKDPGYAFINYLAINIGVSYKLFSGIFSLLIMLCFYPFFSKICHKSLIPLFFFYTTLYLVYPFSGIRQGFTIAVLLGILYPFLIQKKYTFYVVGVLLMALIHPSVIICLFIPFIYEVRLSTRKLILIVIPFVLILFGNIDVFSHIPIAFFQNRVKEYLELVTSANYLPKLVRVLVILPVFLIPDRIYKSNLDLLRIRNILIGGFIIYALFSYSDLTSSRLGIYFRAFEGLFFMLLIHHTVLKKINRQILVCMMLFASVFLAKDINGFIEQGKYENCNIFSYPYLTVFDSENTIIYYRKYYGSADRME